jgi:hypothetical protein
MRKSLLALFAFTLFLVSCSNDTVNWEYKVIYFDASKIQSPDKGYTKTNDFFDRVVSSTTTVPAEAELTKLGKDGWEICTSYLEQETVFPNLLARGDGVSGLQPNVRPQRLVIIFKRPAKKK